METTAAIPIITPEALLSHWQGHRNLTRRVIELFPEREFFEFTIAGMRTFSKLADELIAIGAPGLQAIVARSNQPFNEETIRKTKAEYLEQWDKDTHAINEYWQKLQSEDFSQTFNLFGQYEFPIIQNILYFIDNEIHHRGQAYVYLRALGITPPFFWLRNN